MKQKLLHIAKIIKGQVLYVLNTLYKAGYRFYLDDCFSKASGLSYTTLFALVPLTALIILSYTAFGIEEKTIENNVSEMIGRILPSAETVDFHLFAAPDGAKAADNFNAQKTANPQIVQLRDEIVTNLLTLAQHAKTLGIVTVAVLFFIAVSLLNTIESAFNAIWRANTSNVKFIQKVLNFWAVITLGPLLIALSIFLTSNFGVLNLASTGLETFPRLVVFGGFMFPVVITAFALSLLFYKLPATNVRVRDAFFGGFVTAILFEAVKIGFSYYLSKSTNYAAIYGVLATFPLFLFWMYMAWLVVLYGAEVANMSGSLNIIKEIDRYASDLGELGPLIGLRIMLLYSKAFVSGTKPPSESDLSVETGADAVIVRNCIELLVDAQLLTGYDSGNKAHTINRALNLITVQDVVNAFVKHHAGNSDDLFLLNLVRSYFDQEKTKKDFGTITIDKLMLA